MRSAPVRSIAQPVVLLQRLHSHLALLQRADGAYAGFGGAQVGQHRDAVRHGGASNFDFVLSGRLTAGCVNDECYLAVLDHIENAPLTRVMNYKGGFVSQRLLVLVINA